MASAKSALVVLLTTFLLWFLDFRNYAETPLAESQFALRINGCAHTSGALGA